MRGRFGVFGYVPYLAVLAVLALLSACGGGASSPAATTVTTPSAPGVPAFPPLTLSALSPANSEVGVGLATMEVHGTGFTSATVGVVDGKPVSTIFRSSTDLELQNPASDANAAVHQVAVQQGNVTSNALPWIVYTPAPGPIPFGAARSFFASTGSDFGPVVVADLDGDGFADVIVTAVGLGNTLAILHGDPDGTLGPPQATGISGAIIAASDVNQDGRTDLVISDGTTPSTIAVLVNDGNAHYSRASSLPLPGDFPGGPAQLLDMDGDGLPDLVFAAKDESIAAYRIYVCHNSGGAVFTNARPLAIMAADAAFGIADIDGDGKPDIVFNGVGSTIDGEAHVLINQWPTFAEQVPASLNGARGHVTVGDFNKDGRADVAIQYNEQLQVFLNQGTGFTLASTTTIAPGGFAAYQLVVGDFDGDGIPDMAGVNGEAEPGHALYLWGDGHGSFTAQQVVGPMGFSDTVGDINGDGIPDLIVPDRQNGVTVVLGRHERGMPSPISLTPYTAGNVVISAADVNKDGIVDLFFSGDTFYTHPSPATLFINHGDGTFGSALPEPDNGVLIADLDGDGYAELIGSGVDAPVIWPGDGSGNFANQTPITLTPPSGVAALGQITVADVDGDGHLDLLCGGAIFYGRGGLNFDAVALPITPAFYIGQFDSSPGLDIVTPGFIFLSNGPRSFQRLSSTLALGTGLPVVDAVGDLNGDGLSDVAAGGVSIWYGQLDGNSIENGILSIPDESALAIGDFDGDGKNDIAAALFGPHEAALLRAVGDGTYQRSYFASGASASALLAVDLNRDGKPDLVISNYQLIYRPPNAVVIFAK